MKRKLPILPLFIAAFLANCVQAQSGIALKMINYTVQPNNGIVSLGYTITISAEITNNDSTSFTGTLDFGLRNSQQVLSNAQGIFNKPGYSGNTVQLNGGETVPALFSVEIETPYFAPGPDVVVVWPIANKPMDDSIVISLSIVDPTGIEEMPLRERLLILPDRIQIENDPENPVQQVRFFNLAGAQLNNIAGNPVTEIITAGLPRGIYLCELLTAGNQRAVLRFIR